MLGIDVGTTCVKAAVRHAPVRRGGVPDSGRAGVEPLPLGTHGDAAAAVVLAGDDGSVEVGDLVEDRGPVECDRVARDLVSHIGDDVPLLLGGLLYPAPRLLSSVVTWVIDKAVEAWGAAPEHVALTQPASWTPYECGCLRTELAEAGLDAVTPVPELVAAALDYAAEWPLSAGELVLVCDLGGSGHRAAVLRRTDADAGPDPLFELVAPPEHGGSIPGADPAEAVLAAVRDQLGDVLAGLDPGDPDAWRAAVALRRRCATAVRTLVTADEVEIPLALPGLSALPRSVTLGRADVDDRVRPAALAAVGLVRRAAKAAGVGQDEPRTVLLCGGGAGLPVVRRVLSSELGSPAVTAADPQATGARGVAAAALGIVWPGSNVVPAPRDVLAPVAGDDLATAGETAILFPGELEYDAADVAPRAVPDLDEAAVDLPPRPPVELTPIPFATDYEPVSEQPMWKRVALGGGAVGVIVLLLALAGWLLFGPDDSQDNDQPLSHTTTGQSTTTGSPSTSLGTADNP